MKTWTAQAIQSLYGKGKAINSYALEALLILLDIFDSYNFAEDRNQIGRLGN